MKLCYACKLVQPVINFHKNKSKKLGIADDCKPCARARANTWASQNRERSRLKAAAWYGANRERATETVKRYRNAHPEKKQFWERKRLAALTLATPSWLSEGERRIIDWAYAACPADKAVDHIVPIQGKEVCGLNVPWNLQYLTSKENARKSNQYPWPKEAK